MATEIERKFLLCSDEWRVGAVAYRLIQGYLAREPYRTVRVRMREQQAWMTVKGPTSGYSREEIEFPIAADVARELLLMSIGAVVEKTRHEIHYAGMLWEIDEFHGENEGLVVAEVELPDESHEFELPPWLGREVSDDPRFGNSLLSLRPWSGWTEEERNACRTASQQ